MQKPEDLWANHSKLVSPKPHRKDSPSWIAIQKVLSVEVYVRMYKMKELKHIVQ